MPEKFAPLRVSVWIAGLLLLGCADADASAYSCTEARDEARLGADGSVSSNHGDRKCRWSVNGASYESRAPDSVAVQRRTINALNALTRGDLNNVGPGSPQIGQ